MQVTSIFQTTMQAIHVSYMLASLPATQKGNTQCVVEWMRDCAGKPEPEIPPELRTVNFMGLTREQVRGQCAMVRKAVESRCMAPEIHAFRIKFAEDHTKVEGIEYFTEYLQKTGIESRELRMYVLLWLFSSDRQRSKDGLSLRGFETRFHVDHVAISRAAARMALVMKGLRDVGAKRLNAYFIEKGVVKPEDRKDALDSAETVTL